MVKDLLRDYNENNKPCDNIAESAECCEEDGEDDEPNGNSSGKSDFDRLEYEEALDYLKAPT